MHCLNQGIHYENKHIYLYEKDLKIRTNAKYQQSVELAIATRVPVKGIKGVCFLSEFLTIPDDIILDYMHLSTIGTMKSILNYLINGTSVIKKDKVIFLNMNKNISICLF